MGTLRLLTDVANCRKTMGTSKLLTDVANRRKTMGTLKLLTRKHAILENLNLKTLLYWVASLKTLLREKRVSP